MADLTVELYGSRIGTLRGRGTSFDFVADESAVTAFGLDSLILSAAVPLALVPARGRRARRQNFFAELLPEGRLLDRLALSAGIAHNDVIGMLRAYGRDVAGALQIWDPRVPGEPRAPRLESLTNDGVAELLANASAFPLANKPDGGKTSLNGVQDKIVLAQTPRGWARALDGYPSTHILKPASREYPTIIFDEEFGSRFARAVQVASFDTEVVEFSGTPALVIERYDRELVDGAGTMARRVHQEDFNQALGIRGDQKYQRYGGKVSLARIARELTGLTGHSDIRKLATLTILSVAIGNLDMHAKNVALLHPPNGSVHLAPAYDVVPQAHLPNDGEVALSIDGVYRHRDVTKANLVAEIESWGTRDVADLVDEVLTVIRATALTEIPHPLAHPRLADDIERFTVNLLDGKAVGVPHP